MKKEAFLSKAISNCGHRQRLRERFLELGNRYFSDQEKLELLLTFSIARRDTKVIAKNLLLKYKTLTELFNAPKEELMQIRGIGEKSADLMKMIPEIADLILSAKIEGNEKFNSENKTIAFVRKMIEKKNLTAGDILVIFLNTQCEFIDFIILQDSESEEQLCRKITAAGFENNASMLAVNAIDPDVARKRSFHDNLMNILKENGANLRLHMIDYQFIYPDKNVSIFRNLNQPEEEQKGDMTL